MISELKMICWTSVLTEFLTVIITLNRWNSARITSSKTFKVCSWDTKPHIISGRSSKYLHSTSGQPATQLRSRLVQLNSSCRHPLRQTRNTSRWSTHCKTAVSRTSLEQPLRTWKLQQHATQARSSDLRLRSTVLHLSQKLEDLLKFPSLKVAKSHRRSQGLTWASCYPQRSSLRKLEFKSQLLKLSSVISAIACSLPQPA